MYRIHLLVILLLAAPAMATADEPAPAPDWVLTSADSREVRLSEAVEERPVILFFWATWCPFCKALMPHLQSIELEYGDRVEILALHFRDDNDPTAFIRERGYAFTVLPDAGPVAELYGVHGTPGVIVVDRQRVQRFNLYDFPRPSIPDAVGERGRSAVAAYLAAHWAAAIRRELDKTL